LFGFLTNHDGHIPWQIPARKKLGRRLFGPNPAMYPVRERPWNRSTSASLSKHAQKNRSDPRHPSFCSARMVVNGPKSIFTTNQLNPSRKPVMYNGSVFICNDSHLIKTNPPMNISRYRICHIRNNNFNIRGILFPCKC